jgi:hypothetical protein
MSLFGMFYFSFLFPLYLDKRDNQKSSRKNLSTSSSLGFGEEGEMGKEEKETEEKIGEELCWVRVMYLILLGGVCCRCG